MTTLKRFVIVREMPSVGGMSAQELAGAAKNSCEALRRVGTDKVQWQHSYVAGDRTFCVYLATDEDAIRKHAADAGVPATEIHEV
ncbi:hypothetical protein ABPG75_012711 [Micractinium tetrahymenae]